MSPPNSLLDITSWDHHLLPLLKVFKSSPCPPSSPNLWTFTDSLGRTLDFADHCTWQLPSIKPSLLKLLEARQDAFIELEVDKGHWYYVVQRRGEQHWVVSSVTLDLYGERGGRTECVVVDREGMEELVKVVRGLKNCEDSEDDGEFRPDEDDEGEESSSGSSEEDE